MSDTKKMLRNFTSAFTGNLFGQIISFFLFAYIARIIGPKGYGIFNFAQSLSIYFIIFADLGLSLYCVREYNQNNDESNNIINNVFSLKVYVGIISSIIYFILVVFLKKSAIEKQSLFFIGISVFFNGFFIDYIFNAKSKMKYTGVANFIKNSVWCLLCIAAVKGYNDTILVSLFYSISIIISSVYMIFIYYKIGFNLKLHRLNFKLVKILEYSFPLALSLFMVQINNNFDIVYLGFKKSQLDVGYYSAAYKMINFLISIMCLYFNASYPIIAKMFKYDKEHLNNYMNKFFRIGMYFVIPITVGGMILSDKIMIFLFGNKFLYSGRLFLLLMPLIFIRMVTSTFGSVLMMGNKSKKFSNGVIIGALVNIILNLILVDKFSTMGSAIATLVCELIQGIYLYYYFRKDCKLQYIQILYKPVVGSIIMAIIIYMINYQLIFSIILGVIVYFFVIIILNLKYIRLHLIRSNSHKKNIDFERKD